MAITAGQSFLFQANAGHVPSVTVLSQTIFKNACSGADLHVVRYTESSAGSPVVATWCG